MQRPVRLGLIGCGGIVRISHAPGYQAIPELVRVTALADPVSDNLRRMGEVLAVPPDRRYADHRQMLEHAELDAVTIATPHHMHAEHAMDAAAAGVAVISEKPMATSIEQAQEVLAAVQRHGVPYAVVHNFLFAQGTERARALLAEGAAGTPFFGRAKSLFNKTDDQGRPEPGVARLARGGRRRHQRHRLPRDLPAGDPGGLTRALRRSAGGDRALRLRRGRPGAAAAGARGRRAVHGGHLLVRARRWWSRRLATPARPPTWPRCTARPAACASCAAGAGCGSTRAAPRQWQEVALPPQPTWTESGHARYFAATFDALARGAPPPIGGKPALHNLRIVAAARRATAERRAVDLQAATDD